MSGYSESMSEAEALNFEVLPKPCAPATFAEAIAGAIRK